MTNLKTISKGVFKKNRIVLGSLKSRTLNVASASIGDDLSQPINFDITGCPEGNSALIGGMICRLGDAEKFCDSVFA